jgi:ribosomal protein S18 acetylase RimI-like enzyme
MKRPPEEWTIRVATAGDADRIAAIARAAYARYVPRIGREPAPMTADFPSEIAAGHVVVIEGEGAVQGYLVAWAEADAYFLDNIAVDPAYEGQGYGRALIDHAATEARHRRLPALRLYTNAAMTENIAMYARLGFVETHRATEKGFHRVYFRLDLRGKPPLKGGGGIIPGRL